MKYGDCIQSRPYTQNTAAYDNKYSPDLHYILDVIMTASQSWHMRTLEQIRLLYYLYMKSSCPKQNCLGSRYCLHCIYGCHQWKSSAFSVRLILWLQLEVRFPLRFHSDFHCIDRLVVDCCELLWLDHISERVCIPVRTVLNWKEALLH